MRLGNALLANVYLFLNNKPLISLYVASVQLSRRRKDKQSLIPKEPCVYKSLPFKKANARQQCIQKRIYGAFVLEQLKVWLSRTD